MLGRLSTTRTDLPQSFASWAKIAPYRPEPTIRYLYFIKMHLTRYNLIRYLTTGILLIAAAAIPALINTAMKKINDRIIVSTVIKC